MNLISETDINTGEPKVVIIESKLDLVTGQLKVDTASDSKDVTISIGTQDFYWQKLKRLAGYVANGTDTKITLYQDDATGNFHIKVGERDNFGSCFEEALYKFDERLE